MPHLGVNEKILNRAFDLAANGSPTEIKPLEAVPTSALEDRVLLRLYIVYQVLKTLGFSEKRIEECILTGLGAGEGFEEALEWVSATV